MPPQANALLEPFQNLKYIDYSLLLQSLNTPLVWGTLIVSAVIMVFAYASYRRHLFHTSITGAGMGFLVGVILTLAIQAVVVNKFIGFNRFLTIFQPKPPSAAQTTQDTRILGNATACPSTLDQFFTVISPQKAREVKLALCQEVLREIK